MKVNPKYVGKVENFVLWTQLEKLEFDDLGVEMLVTLGIADDIAQDGTVIGQGFCVEHVQASYQNGKVKFDWPDYLRPYRAEVLWTLQYLVEAMCKDGLLALQDEKCNAFIDLDEQTLLD